MPIHIWDKVFKSRPSKVCGRQLLKHLKGYGLLKHVKFVMINCYFSFRFCTFARGVDCNTNVKPEVESDTWHHIIFTYDDVEVEAGVFLNLEVNFLDIQIFCYSFH